MSMNIGPSSSLTTLERYNHSKSTVSSTDTDVSSAGYASSSGTTTPEDDSEMFHLGPTLQNILTDKPPKSSPREKLSIVTKRHNFSSAIKKVKKVAHALTAFKKKRTDDISPILISSPLRERFGKRMSVKPHPDESFYSLPNRRFSFSDVRTPPHEKRSRTIRRKFGTISGSTSTPVNGMFKKPRSGHRMPTFPDSPRSALPSLASPAVVPPTKSDVVTFRTILVPLIRVLLFIPWCAAVGGALLLFPNHVELVAFRPGYLPSPKGIRRFAHWAECGQQHVMIFLAFLVAMLWYNRTLGLSAISVVASRFVLVWHAFRVDKSIPLGEDDQQSLYLVITGLASREGSFSVGTSRSGQTGIGTDDSA